MKVTSILFLSLVLSATLAEAQTTYYVAKDGSDSNPCTQARPCSKISRTSAKLAPGDTLIVKAGKYKEVLNDVIPSGTSWSQPVTIKANPGDNVTILPKASQAAYRVLYFAYPDTQYVIIDGFKIDARNVQGEAVKITTGAHHIRIQNCEITKAATMGILITDPDTTHNEIINCTIHKIGSNTQLDHAVYITTSDNLVDGCLIYDALSHGIHLYGDPGMDRNVFRNNVIHDCKRGIGVYGGSNNLICNNVIYDHTEYGILLRNDAGDLASTMIYNNTIYNAGNVGIYNYTTNKSATLIRNNIVFDQAQGITDETGVALVEKNLAGVDPKFSNQDARDLHLKSASPAIDAGDTLTEVTTDKDGIKRPQGAAYDIGAYEYSGPDRGGAALLSHSEKGRASAEFDYRLAIPIALLICGLLMLVSYKHLRTGSNLL